MLRDQNQGPELSGTRLLPKHLIIYSGIVLETPGDEILLVAMVTNSQHRSLSLYLTSADISIFCAAAGLIIVHCERVPGTASLSAP